MCKNSISPVLFICVGSIEQGILNFDTFKHKFLIVYKNFIYSALLIS